MTPRKISLFVLALLLAACGCVPVAWLPDSSGFVCSLENQGNATFRLMHYDLAKKKMRVVVEKVPAATFWPAISPDGKQIAVAQLAGDGKHLQMRVIIYDLEGKETHRSSQFPWVKTRDGVNDLAATGVFWSAKTGKILVHDYLDISEKGDAGGKLRHLRPGKENHGHRQGPADAVCGLAVASRRQGLSGHEEGSRNCSCRLGRQGSADPAGRRNRCSAGQRHAGHRPLDRHVVLDGPNRRGRFRHHPAADRHGQADLHPGKDPQGKRDRGRQRHNPAVCLSRQRLSGARPWSRRRTPASCAGWSWSRKAPSPSSWPRRSGTTTASSCRRRRTANGWLCACRRLKRLTKAYSSSAAPVKFAK